jgi:membrane protein DedA with SNARE-associated domain
VGDAAMYGIGRRWGRSLIQRHPRWAHLLGAEREARFEARLRKHQFKVLFMARFMVGVRSPVYFSAGVLRIPFRRFLLMDLLCASAVVAAFFGIAYLAGERLADGLRNAELGFTIVVGAAAAIIGIGYYYRQRRRAAVYAAIQSRRREAAQRREQARESQQSRSAV